MTNSKSYGIQAVTVLAAGALFGGVTIARDRVYMLFPILVAFFLAALFQRSAPPSSEVLQAAGKLLVSSGKSTSDEGK